jgi:uncharacterized protein (DUF1800 family)
MDRRKFLVGSGATLASAAGLAKSENSFAYASGNIPGYSIQDKSNPQPLSTQSNDLSSYTGPWTDTTLRHLLRRAMFGVPLAQFQTAKAMNGMSAVVDKLLADQTMPAKPAAYVDTIVVADPNEPDKNKAGMEAGNHERVRAEQVANWWMDLILQENLSIRERMTLLWSNHFVIGADVVPQTAFLYTYNQTLRANALGNMKTFTRAISVDPGMLIYLNGNQNYDGVKPGGGGRKGTNINENYARELQELFTLGLTDPVSAAPNYSEDDVQQAAKALTGWAPTITAPFVGTFYPTGHNNDQKTFLRQTGNWGLDDIINIIFSYKGPGGDTKPGFNTAYWFCEKIYMEFVYYVPNPEVVTAMANFMVDTNFEVKMVLKALLESAHFYDVNVQNAQLKSPVNFMASLIREFGLTYNTFDPTDPPEGTPDKNGVKQWTDPNPTLTYISLQTAGVSLGQLLLQPPNVKGWPGGHNWISTGTFQNRQNISGAFLINPPYFDGSSKARGITIGLQKPSQWAEAIPNSGTLSSHELSSALTSLALNKTLGPNESGTLYSSINPQNLPENDFYLDDKAVANFAIAVAQLPEFQLV